MNKLYRSQGRGRGIEPCPSPVGLMAGDVTGRCPRTVAAQWGQGPPGSGRPGAGAVREGGAARADASLAVAPQKRAAAGSASTEPRASPDTRRRPSASGSGPGVFPAPPGAGGPPPPARAPPPAMQAIRRRRVRTAAGLPRARPPRAARVPSPPGPRCPAKLPRPFQSHCSPERPGRSGAGDFCWPRHDLAKNG